MPRPLPPLDAATTALVLIDLQRGIVARPGAPHPAGTVVRNAARLASAARAAGTLVVLVHVSYAGDRADAVRLDTDEQMGGGPLPPGWDELVDELGRRPSDLVVTKRQWGAFYGTDLDLQLRRRGRHTIVLGGIATNLGVESTARDAYERNYQLVLVEDAMTSFSEADHAASVTRIFPRLGRVTSTDAVLDAWAKTGP